jgi:hypothetical protein
MNLADLTNQELRQIEWRGSMLRFFKQRGDDMRFFGEDWETRLAASEAADAELTRRGDEERFT